MSNDTTVIKWSFTCTCWAELRVEFRMLKSSSVHEQEEAARREARARGWKDGADNFLCCSWACVWLQKERIRLHAQSFNTGTYDQEADDRLAAEADMKRASGAES